MKYTIQIWMDHAWRIVHELDVARGEGEPALRECNAVYETLMVSCDAPLILHMGGPKMVGSRSSGPRPGLPPIDDIAVITDIVEKRVYQFHARGG